MPKLKSIINTNKIFFLISLISLIIILTFSALIRIFRDFFQIPGIGKEKIVGFAQFYGYPIYFDNLFFLLLLATPIAVSFLVYRFKND